MAFVFAAFAAFSFVVGNPIAEPAITSAASSSINPVTHAPGGSPTSNPSLTGAWTFKPTTFPPIQPGLYPHNSHAVFPTTSAPTVPTPVADLEKRASSSSISQWQVWLFNQMGVTMSVSYQGNAGAPSAVYGGTPGIVTTGGNTLFAYPTGWAGRVYVQYGGKYVGYDGGNTNIPVDPRGSKIEGSLMGNVLDVDISYVDGYSTTLSCYCNGVRVTGCTHNLWVEQTCPKNQVSPNGFVCYNPQQNVPCGPPTQYFASCQGHAYTYPDDDQANSAGECTGTIICCADVFFGSDQKCPQEPDAGHLKYGSSPNPQCGGSGTTSKRALPAPVDPEEGHWFYNSTLYAEYERSMKERGLPVDKIPDHIFKTK